jgi:hypothetical protein
MSVKVFDAYVRLEKNMSKKSVYNVAIKKGSYPMFDIVTSYYLMDDKADYVNSSRLRKPTYKLTANKGVNHVSGIFMPNSKIWGYGDVRMSTNDLLIFKIDENKQTIEIFLALNKAGQWNLILNMILDEIIKKEIEDWQSIEF